VKGPQQRHASLSVTLNIASSAAGRLTPFALEEVQKNGAEAAPQQLKLTNKEVRVNNYDHALTHGPARNAHAVPKVDNEDTTSMAALTELSVRFGSMALSRSSARNGQDWA
jgi:hypothetical protein